MAEIYQRRKVIEIKIIYHNFGIKIYMERMMYMNNMKEDTNKKIMTYYQILFYFPCYSVHTTTVLKNETEPEDKIYFIPELPKNGFGYL